MNEWMGGWVDGWMGGWIDGFEDVSTESEKGWLLNPEFLTDSDGNANKFNDKFIMLRS